MVGNRTDEAPGVEPIGAKVRRLRSERGLTQDRLALEARVDQSGLSKFERSSTKLGAVPLRRIADVLGVPFEVLIKDTDYGAVSQRPQS